MRELRRLALGPVCPVCKRGGQSLTIELAREPGEELQLDWLELAETPWGQAGSAARPAVGAPTGWRRSSSPPRTAAAGLAKHYGFTIAVCPRYRPQPNGVVEARLAEKAA